MPYTVNITGSTELDSGLVTAFYKGFLLSAYQENIFDSFVSLKERQMAKSIEFTKYANLDPATTELDQYEDVTSSVMSDDKVVITPKEYGKVVTRTLLSNFQSGGKVDLAAAKVVGINMSRSTDLLCINSIMNDANLDERFAFDTSKTSINALTNTNVLTAAQLNKAYNVMARKNIIPFEGGSYVALMHDDLIAQIRSETGAGGWVDVNKYSNPTAIFKNEVGSMHGMRIVRDNNMPLTDNTASKTCSPIIVLGQNALAKGISVEPHLTITGPFDKLGRFLNIGQYGIFNYGVIDTESVLACWFYCD